VTAHITVNGEERAVHAPPLTPLGRVLREDLHLTGTKLVCGEGFCGSCQVFLDDVAVNSCLVPLAAVDGRSIRTIESIAEPRGPLSAVQQALKDADAVQCGMCFPGMVISITSLLAERPHPTKPEVQSALVGNLCRCTGYERIVDAVVWLGAREVSGE
jgi:aerobic carbon-monoxide dehydrogenase small subunit